MTAQVLFMNSFYVPDDETRKKLEFYQEQLSLYHCEVAFKSREMSAGEKYLFKETSHNNVRKSWRLILSEN